MLGLTSVKLKSSKLKKAKQCKNSRMKRRSQADIFM